MRKLKLLIFFTAMCSLLHSQVTVDNDRAHRRYWYYRTRMINDFIKIGKNQGDCIVFAERNATYVNGIQEESTTGPDQMDITNMYIMALALEYKILSRNNQDVSETVKEIYHLLYTINRLDLEADQFWDAEPTNDIIQPNGTLNGFMLREDMPANYVGQNLTHYNYSLFENNYPNTPNPYTSYGGFTGTFHTNQLDNDNLFSRHFTSASDVPKSKMPLSQDKYHSMLVAMMFIDKYIPSSVDYNGEAFQDGITSIRQEAREIAKRVYNYCKGVNNAWKLRYLDRLGFSHGNLSNSVGGDAWIYSFALSRMACHADSDFPWSTYFVSGCSNYADPNAQTFGYSEYSLQAGSPAVTMDAAVFKTWDAAGANCAAQIGGQPIPIPAFFFMQNNTSSWSLEWSELLRKVLHQNGALLRQLSVYGDAINAAPCQGPYNFGNCNDGGFEWSSQDRLEHPNSRGNGCHNSRGAFTANYPGVDYMLLHNLYYEYQNQLMDGNQGNVGNTPGGNVVTWIYNASNTVGSTVVSAGCSVINAISGLFGGSTSVCDPTNTSGNGGAGSNNVTLSPYYGYNLMDNTDENIWPRRIFYSGPLVNSPTNIQGVNQAGKEGKVAVFQNLTLKSHIYATSSPAAPNNTIPSNVTYRAGKEIIIPPGQFIVDNGATCHIYIQRYLCSGNNDALQMRHTRDSTQMLEFQALDYETDPINPIPLHYVESPKSDADNNPTVPETDYYQELKAFESIRENTLLIAPNPSTGKITIYTKKIDASEIIDLQLVDMKGVLILSLENINEEQTINLENYGEGIYMVQITSNFEKNMIKKITIIK